MAEGWDLVAEERRNMADLVEGLTPEQSATPSLCEGWTCKQTAAHLLTFTDLSLPGFMWQMLKHGFNYDQAADTLAKQFGEESNEEIATSLRERAAKPASLSMFPPEMTLSDVVIHQQDIRRPLGMTDKPDDQSVQTALEFLTTQKQAKNILDPERLLGLHFEATDLDWSHGSGPEVKGKGEALMMAMAGRDVLDELDGDGVEQLRGS